MRTPQGIEAKIDRTVHAEGAIAELKRHGLTRARSRGTRKLQLQLLAAATAINLKRLLAHPGAQSASDDQDEQSRTLRCIASTPGARHIAATWLLNILTAALNEIDRLAATDTSTGS